ncbi:MAG: hypothetical protein QG595_1463 [Pseudomonadota bacterium]|mgnify:FL=1|nr:hypothetical protein [Pseudomonadota bacterium]
MKKLNTAQRFWLLGSLAMLATTVAIIFMQWPLRDPEVMADLQASECAQWRELPAARVDEAWPMTGDACFALRTLMVRDEVVISSMDDYDKYRRATGIKRAFRSLLTWASIMGGIYVIAWVNSRIAAKFLELKTRKSR